MLPNFQNLSLFFFTLQTQRKNTASTSHTKSAAAAAAWSAFCHRLIWFFNSLFLSFFHYESVFDMLFHLICVSESPYVCFDFFCWVFESWTIGLCVGELWRWTSDICSWTQLEFWVSIWPCLCVGLWGLMGYRHI